MILLVLVTLVAPQDDPARQARELVEKLRSDSVEEREKATQELLKMDRWILQTLRREMAKASDKETQGRIADVIEAMAAVAVFTPGLSPKATESLKDVLVGKDKDAHVVTFSNLGKALDSKAELLVLWLEDEERDVDNASLEKLKNRRTIGFDRRCAWMFGRMGLEINAGACAEDEETTPRIKPEKGALGMKAVPENALVAFRLPRPSGSGLVNSIMYIPRKSRYREFVEVVARCADSQAYPHVPNYAPLVRQGNHLFIGLGGAPDTWTQEFSEFFHEIARAMQGRKLEAFSRAKWAVTKPGTYAFELADGNSTIESSDRDDFFRFTKPTRLRIVLTHKGSDSIMLAGFHGRKDAHAEEPLKIDVEITEREIKETGDGYWILRLANFDRSHKAECTLKIEYKE